MTSVTRATAADARVASYRSAYLYAGLSNLIFYVPVLLLYFRALGVSAADSIALVSIYAFVLALTDLPTGVLADALGPRATLSFSLRRNVSNVCSSRSWLVGSLMSLQKLGTRMCNQTHINVNLEFEFDASPKSN